MKTFPPVVMAHVSINTMKMHARYAHILHVPRQVIINFQTGISVIGCDQNVDEVDNLYEKETNLIFSHKHIPFLLKMYLLYYRCMRNQKY